MCVYYWQLNDKLLYDRIRDTLLKIIINFLINIKINIIIITLWQILKIMI